MFDERRLSGTINSHQPVYETLSRLKAHVIKGEALPKIKKRASKWSMPVVKVPVKAQVKLVLNRECVGIADIDVKKVLEPSLSAVVTLEIIADVDVEASVPVIGITDHAAADKWLVLGRN